MKYNYTELKRQARETLNKHYSIPMTGLVISSLIADCLFLPFDLTVNNSASPSAIFYIAGFLIALLTTLFSCGLCYMHLKMRENKPYGIKDIFYFFTHHPDRFLLTGLFLIGITILIFLPAILVIAAAYYFHTTPFFAAAILTSVVFFLAALSVLYNYALVFYFLIDYPKMQVSAALKESRRTMKGNKMRLFLLHLSFAGWFVLGVCSCCIGFLWIEPYFAQTMISFYFDLTNRPLSPTQKHI